jgi:hypothetical protein
MLRSLEVRDDLDSRRLRFHLHSHRPTYRASNNPNKSCYFAYGRTTLRAWHAEYCACWFAKCSFAVARRTEVAGSCDPPLFLDRAGSRLRVHGDYDCAATRRAARNSKKLSSLRTRSSTTRAPRSKRGGSRCKSWRVRQWGRHGGIRAGFGTTTPPILLSACSSAAEQRSLKPPSIEQRVFNSLVAGSNPATRSTFHLTVVHIILQCPHGNERIHQTLQFHCRLYHLVGT